MRARKPPTDTKNFGYGRAEVVGALSSIGLLWGLAAILTVFAIPRLFEPQPADAKLMLLLGVIGLVTNLVLGIVIGHGHSPNYDHHDHNDHQGHHGHHEHHDHHDHHKTSEAVGSQIFWGRLTGSDIESVNLRACYLHIIGDVLQNLGVIAAANIVLSYPQLTIMNPICTIFFACVIIYTTKGLAPDLLNVLLEGMPRGVSSVQVGKRILAMDEVLRVHELRIWSIWSLMYANARTRDVLAAVRNVLKHEFGIKLTTVEISDEE